jgi:hemerythrin
MPIIEWNDTYKIGELQIDLHHQYLFSLLNSNYDNFVNGAPDASLSSLFHDLIDYVIYHFFTEEEFMKKIQFPGLEKHKKEHDGFAQRVVEMDKEMERGKQAMSLEVLTFLHDWLTTHILKSDAEIGCFLNAGKESSKAGTKSRKVSV